MERKGVTDLYSRQPRHSHRPDIAFYSIEVIVWLMFVDSTRENGLSRNRDKGL